MVTRPTQTGIINRALALLGSTARIGSILDTAGPAVHAREHWDALLRRLLADHPWNFALQRRLLNEAADAPVFGYDRSFTLPDDCLRWLPPSVDSDDWFEGVLEGPDQILTNAAVPLPVRYVSLDLGEQVARWPSWFEDAMVCAMAEALAEPITQSEGIKQGMAEAAQRALAKAKRKDGLESGGKRRVSVDARSRWNGARTRPYTGHR